MCRRFFQVALDDEVSVTSGVSQHFKQLQVMEYPGRPHNLST